MIISTNIRKKRVMKNTAGYEKLFAHNTNCLEHRLNIKLIDHGELQDCKKILQKNMVVKHSILLLMLDFK